MKKNILTSWGRYPYEKQYPHSIYWLQDVQPTIQKIRSTSSKSMLAYGCGRSYGDSCLSQSNHVLSMSSMNHFHLADWKTGLIEIEAGVTLATLIEITLPKGWFLPVTPGTKFVTIGGAVANDVHGKNHHVMGTLGQHIRYFTLYREDQGVITCSSTENSELFNATIGGLGLTGIILTVAIQLRRISSNQIEQHSFRFGGLNEFFSLSEKYDKHFEYTVAWIDCLAKGEKLGRGHYIAGRHQTVGALQLPRKKSRCMSLDPPISLVNPWTLRVFNSLYYYRHWQKSRVQNILYEPFFYPLDKIAEWNRMYGRKGFQQFQCVIPHANGKEGIRALLNEITKNRTGSFLAVLKQCGTLISPGLLSFPLHGVSLALDFPQNNQLNHLFSRLDALVHECGGRLYPAKDAHMSAEHFKRAYPNWEKIEAVREPYLLSQFWRRVTQ